MSTKKPYQQVSEGAIITVGSPLGAGYHSYEIKDYSIACRVAGQLISRLPLFVNTPIPVHLPTWPRALSLSPDLSEREN